MEPNYIFGLTNQLLTYKQPIRSGWLVDSGGRDYRIGMGTPCLIIVAPDGHTILSPYTKGPRKIALFPFTLQSSIKNRLILDTHNNVNCLALKVGKETDFFNNIKEINLGQFDHNKINQAATLVKDAGPLTLLIDKPSKNGFITDLKLLMTSFAKKYKLSFQGKYNHNGCKSLIDGDRCVLAITLIDIKQCIPIYNIDKVDGIVVHITAMYTAQNIIKDRLINSFELTFYFSNHATNLLKVDGQQLNRTPCSINNILELITSSTDYMKDVGKVKPCKEVKKISYKEGKSKKYTLKKDVDPRAYSNLF